MLQGAQSPDVYERFRPRDGDRNALNCKDRRTSPRGVRPSARPAILPAVAKDTEKLIRQLSLISFLMAKRRR